MTFETHEYQVAVVNDNENAVDLLATETGFSKQKIKQIMQKGAVWLTNNKGTHRLRRKSKKLTSGSTVHLYYDPLVLNEEVAAAVLISDEGSYSVWYKPRGMLSQGSKWGDHCVINRYVEQNLEPQRPAFVVHRLDRFASGLILIAHKKNVTTLLANLFKNKTIQKQYKAIIEGKFSEQQTYTNEIDGKPAVSHVSLLLYDKVNNESLVCVSIETGRKHQIRKHLSEAGFPIVGDRGYGHGNKDERDLQLTAFKLEFICPDTQVQKEYTLDDSLQPQLKIDT